MESSGQYSDPIGESLSYSSQRLAQLISLLTAVAEVGARRRAMHNARSAAADEQEIREAQQQQRALHEQARARWAAAHDPGWLSQAGLLETARAWSAAVPYAADDPLAASAVRKCEERLRVLHPYAMARYDRLCSEGAGPLDAMSEAAPMFTRASSARPGPAGNRSGIEAANATTAPGPASAEISATAEYARDPFAQAEARGREIVARLQARARQARGSGLPAAELITVLEETTTLPGEVIARIARAREEEQDAGTAENARAAHLHDAAQAHSGERAAYQDSARRDTQAAARAGARAAEEWTAAQLATDSFGCTVQDGIRAAVNGTLAQPASAMSPSPAAVTRQASA